MGTQEVKANLSVDERNRFLKAMLNDVRALEKMLDEGRFETGICRIGAEQEVVMIDRDYQPAPIAMEVLEDLDDPRVTTEIARFNLEANLSPLEFKGDCLARMEHEINDVLDELRVAVRKQGAEILLAGILPTLTKSHLGVENISDRPRYFALDEALSSLRGGAYELQIKGIDEVSIEHESVMLEALNTSFQLHYQVDPDAFADTYNLAQLITGPLLAAAVNSPVLFGKRLWRETRIAIFQQTVDTRLDAPHHRDLLGRVRFGEDWVESSVMEIFRNDISRFRVILGCDVDEDPFEILDAGGAPKLRALQLFNSTIYRWNRACYGISNGLPHLRIENRVLPAGPTVLDEVANAAFWFGMMHAGVEAYGDIRQKVDFDEARANFLAAARQGMHAELSWLNGALYTAQDLLRKELLPLARTGLQKAGIDGADIDRYLAVIERRIETRQTGAQWLLDSVHGMKGHGTRGERLAALTSATLSRQTSANGVDPQPVHEWPLARITEAGCWTRNFQRIEQYMVTDLFTVHPDDTIDLVVTLMDWEHIRHVPVEDDHHRLVGLVTHRTLLTHLARNMNSGKDSKEVSIPVRDIMKPEPITVSPETSTLDAIALMREHRVSCLPVTNDGQLVGLITEHDFMPIARQLLEEQLRGRPEVEITDDARRLSETRDSESSTSSS